MMKVWDVVLLAFLPLRWHFVASMRTQKGPKTLTFPNVHLDSEDVNLKGYTTKFKMRQGTLQKEHVTSHGPMLNNMGGDHGGSTPVLERVTVLTCKSGLVQDPPLESIHKKETKEDRCALKKLLSPCSVRLKAMLRTFLMCGIMQKEEKWKHLVTCPFVPIWWGAVAGKKKGTKHYAVVLKGGLEYPNGQISTYEEELHALRNLSHAVRAMGSYLIAQERVAETTRSAPQVILGSAVPFFLRVVTTQPKHDTIIVLDSMDVVLPTKMALIGLEEESVPLTKTKKKKKVKKVVKKVVKKTVKVDKGVLNVVRRMKLSLQKLTEQLALTAGHAEAFEKADSLSKFDGDGPEDEMVKKARLLKEDLGVRKDLLVGGDSPWKGVTQLGHLPKALWNLMGRIDEVAGLRHAEQRSVKFWREHLDSIKAAGQKKAKDMKKMLEAAKKSEKSPAVSQVASAKLGGEEAAEEVAAEEVKNLITEDAIDETGDKECDDDDEGMEEVEVEEEVYEDKCEEKDEACKEVWVVCDDEDTGDTGCEDCQEDEECYAELKES